MKLQISQNKTDKEKSSFTLIEQRNTISASLPAATK